MSPIKIAFISGLAMFAMFFGSGNLVFPILIGAKTTDQYLLASLGIFLTGVVVPFLGLFSMTIYEGNKDVYFGLLGKWAPFLLSLFILSLIGPFGVIPRCIVVSYGGMSLLYPEIPLYIFSIFFLLIAFLILLRKNKIVPIIGKWLGPIKIIAIILIIVAAIIQSPKLVVKENFENPLILGLTQGYQTMDLLASFFFSITIIQYLLTVCSSKEKMLKISFFASVIGGSLIAIVYLGFIYLGAYYSSELQNIKPEQYITTIADLTLGDYAAVIVAFTIFLSCLITAASLLKLFAEFLKTDVLKDKISWNSSIIISMIISFVISLTGFTNIATLLHLILVYLYPALITLSITAILAKYYNFKWIKETFWGTLLISIILNAI